MQALLDTPMTGDEGWLTPQLSLRLTRLAILRQKLARALEAWVASDDWDEREYALVRAVETFLEETE